MESIVGTFHIDWKIIIAQAINFGVVFLVLYMFALKPLKKIMLERSGKISKGLGDAKENAALLDRTKKEYEEVLNKARIEAQKIFDDGKRDASKAKEQMMNDAKAEVDTMINTGKKTLEQEKSKMVADAKKELVGVVVAAAEKIMGESKGFDEKAIKELNNI
jgi:F-type H+-transporting ATPase subunit b